MGKGFDVGDLLFSCFLTENFQHPRRSVDGGDFSDMRAQGPGNQAGAAAVFENLHRAGQGDNLLYRLGHSAGKGNALRFFVPFRGGVIESFYIIGGNLFRVGGHCREFQGVALKMQGMKGLPAPDLLHGNLCWKTRPAFSSPKEIRYGNEAGKNVQ
jgi:hypothetical protein